MGLKDKAKAEVKKKAKKAVKKAALAVIKPFLPYNAKVWFENNERIFYFVFIILWITGIAGSIISPIIKLVYTFLMNLGSFIF